jgi:hypothetical protein
MSAGSDGSCGDQCVHNGGRCEQGTCHFDCQDPGSCASQQVLCPEGYPCSVVCGNRACVNNVVCGVNAQCDIQCVGDASCASEIICSGNCNVTCSGARSCRGGLGGASQGLQAVCSGSQSCGGTVQCEGAACNVSCTGQQSCDRVNIFGTTNELSCTGNDSCGTKVTCNGDSCKATCSTRACRKGIDCEAVECHTGQAGESEGG